MRRSPVVGAAFGLLSFYWISLFLFDLIRGDIGLGGAWVVRLSERGLAMAGGGLVGVLVVGYGIWLKRKLARMRLIGDNVRGVTCTIGELPVILHAPLQAKDVMGVERLRLPKHKCIDPQWMRKWVDEYEGKYPAHAKMLRACERVMHAKPTLPAACKNGERKGYAYGYDGHNHGNHTLIEHAYTTGAVGVHLSATFEFEGAFKTNAHGEREGIDKKNPNYKFDASDPMIGLLCYAHDIGKVETFGFNDKGEVVAIDGEHDLAGARLMARMDEFWDLPDEDRMILLLAVSHYHKPSEMPLDRNGQLISDRCQALLEVVIEADIRAGLIENGQEDELGKSRDVPIIEETYVVNLWRAFIELMIESGRINGSRDKYGIGQKNVVDKRPLVIVYEKDVREELLTRMELRNSHKGRLDKDGICVLTRDLLRILFEKDMLVTTAGDTTAETPEDALWQIDWYGRDPKRAGAPISKSMCTIVFEPKGEISMLAEMLDHDSVPKLVGLFRDGEKEDTRKARFREISLVPAAGSGEEDEFVVPKILEGSKKKKRDKNRTAPAQGRAAEEDQKNTEVQEIAKATGARSAKEQQEKPERVGAKVELKEQLDLLATEAADLEEVILDAVSDAPVVNEELAAGQKETARDNPSLTTALRGVQMQIREKVRGGLSQREGEARRAVGKAIRHPVKRGLMRALELAESGDLPSEAIGEGKIAVSVEALKALERGIPWLSETVVTEFLARKWPGVRVTRRDNGVFMLELDRHLVEAHQPKDASAGATVSG